MVTDRTARAAGGNNSAQRTNPPGAEALLEVVEPRCRICRDPLVRRQVNELLEERRLVDAMLNLCGDSTSTTAAPSKITYIDVLAELEPINDARAKQDRITYTSLWNHAHRHDSAEGRAAYWAARIEKELHRALWGHRGPVERRSPHV